MYVTKGASLPTAQIVPQMVEDLPVTCGTSDQVTLLRVHLLLEQILFNH